MSVITRGLKDSEELTTDEKYYRIWLRSWIVTIPFLIFLPPLALWDNTRFAYWKSTMDNIAILAFYIHLYEWAWFAFLFFMLMETFYLGPQHGVLLVLSALAGSVRYMMMTDNYKLYLKLMFLVPGLIDINIKQVVVHAILLYFT